MAVRKRTRTGPVRKRGPKKSQEEIGGDPSSIPNLAVKGKPRDFMLTIAYKSGLQVQAVRRGHSALDAFRRESDALRTEGSKNWSLVRWHDPDTNMWNYVPKGSRVWSREAGHCQVEVG